MKKALLLTMCLIIATALSGYTKKHDIPILDLDWTMTKDDVMKRYKLSGGYGAQVCYIKNLDQSKIDELNRLFHFPWEMKLTFNDGGYLSRVDFVVKTVFQYRFNTIKNKLLWYFKKHYAGQWQKSTHMGMGWVENYLMKLQKHTVWLHAVFTYRSNSKAQYKELTLTIHKNR